MVVDLDHAHHAAGGSRVAVTTTTPGQTGRLTFTGTLGDRVSLKATTGPSGAMTIVKPNGTALVSGSISGAIPTFV